VPDSAQSPDAPADDLTDPLPLARALIRCPSVTPEDAGALDVLIAALSRLGFACHDLTFAAPGTAPVRNLYARLDGPPGAPVFGFAGHTDVVPPGDGWHHDPFAAVVEDGILHGRGAADMKGAIACFVAALARRLARGPLPGTVAMLITGDEEGPSINGTRPLLEWMAERGERLDACLVGEPTNPVALGDEIKIGRRGSLNARLTVRGTQGHSAYLRQADNPIDRMVAMLSALIGEPLDAGSEHFEPSTLALTTVDVGNPATNVVPGVARAAFNVRFNDRHDPESLVALLRRRLAAVCPDESLWDLKTTVSGVSFLTRPGPLVDAVAGAVAAVTGRTPALTTAGGTSDARFVKDVCPVCEFGLVNRTIHRADECVPLADLAALTAIHEAVLDRVFADPGPGGGGEGGR